ncbi:hypothetical protein P9D57_01110 [Bacillus sonorensis]|uniref:hypothetical protein n=1 Tax=Bacillus sonorensis TaxID=119858 RepID=UPI002DB98302|nr:hypothetical protein [Bacillus sonorensis]MEC1437370.1 hypothetical protein [Bacillus sonorensis]
MNGLIGSIELKDWEDIKFGIEVYKDKTLFSIEDDDDLKEVEFEEKDCRLLYEFLKKHYE